MFTTTQLVTMRLLFAVATLGIGGLGLLFVPAAAWGAPSVFSGCAATSPPAGDSTGAQLHMERQGTMLRVQGLFANESTEAGPLTYELDVQRTGDAGTSRTTQSGRFETVPGRTDTLSTVRVNVQAGDDAVVHFTVRRADTVVDAIRRRRAF